MTPLKRMAVSGAALAFLLACGAGAGFAQDPASQQPPAANNSTQAPAGDNTKMNAQDRTDNRVTADQQQENQTDRELTQRVRKAIMQDKSLSTYAHNVKIISQNGTVTLKGPVRTDEEKRAIEAQASQVAGQGKVVNDLTVVPE